MSDTSQAPAIQLSAEQVAVLQGLHAQALRQLQEGEQ